MPGTDSQKAERFQQRHLWQGTDGGWQPEYGRSRISKRQGFLPHRSRPGKILTEESNRVILQQLLPEAILATYEALDDEGEEAYDINSSLNSSQLPMVKDVKNIFPNLSELLHWASAVTIGRVWALAKKRNFWWNLC